jgi:superfamily II DNA or RNA helicase/phage repressor protein C with HTH and peptisase S24 domain
MEHESSCFQDDLQYWLYNLGFDQLGREDTGCIFLNKKDDICLVVDTVICELPDYPYVAYTSRQNELMAAHSQVFRFLFDSADSFDTIQQEILLFLGGESDPEQIKRFGANRAEQEPDPTQPEATFEDCFLEAFGDQARMGLHREFAYVDLEGTTRYIDYALFAESAKFAIELNGESFHHPVAIGPRRYRSQLFKQNSLVADGFKVFRWSLNGMRDRERFILELSRFMGHAGPFLEKSVFKLRRSVQTFTLKAHQQQSLDQLSEARENGRNTFLLVLPTGTGKTEIFIEDLVRLKKHDQDLKALVIVPTRKLREQTMARFKLRLPHHLQERISDDILSENTADFLVQTTAYLHRHYYKIPADRFDYIVVDEAHHAAAHGLRNILEHFIPTHLLGVTATPERFDQQCLEKIFGEYEPQLSLEDAIRQGLVPPVRCYRIKSNIDLSEVRFNGREFVKNDLQRTLLVPSRDQLIADLLKRYFDDDFSHKQGVIFCVDIKHARRMADLLKTQGITAAAVDGRDRKNAVKAQKSYDDGTIRFLCACDLLTEGWDAPQTSILVMARPTFSKVLYTQQLGRGLRNYQGKEALYVIDVVDNYGARLQPLSLHSLFKIPNYQPFANLIDPEQPSRTEEIILLDGLYEGERRIEPVDIFSFEEMYGSFLNEEQLARELFVSTGTVRQWLRKGTISSDLQYPFGRRQLHFFDPRQVEKIREQQGLKEHNAETRVADFHEFLEKRDYTFSYKIIFLLSFFKICNDRFEAHLPALIGLYQQFYQNLLARNGKNEREKCPYNRQEYIEDAKVIQRSLLENPFEKFERKRFFYHCSDLDYLAMDPELINNLAPEQYQKIVDQMVQDLHDYYGKLEMPLSETDYSFLLPEPQQEQPLTLFIDEPTEEQKYTTVLPFYPLSIAAGEFMDSAAPSEPESWFMVEGRTTRRALSSPMFVAQIQGKSMEPVIQDGAYCLFTFEVGGTRNGRIVLARKANISDPDTGAGFTVKTYHSTKKVDPDTGWQHESITLKPANPAYQDIVIPPDEADDFRIVAFFIEVLAGEERRS